MRTCFTYKIALACLLVVTALSGAYAQDIHFSQFFEAPLLRNPALAGVFTGDYRVQGVYRDQWNSVTDGYRTGSFNGDYKLPVGKGDDFLTLGMETVFDKAGTVGLTTTEVFPALNYHKSLSDQRTMYLSLGFMGGLAQKSIDRSKITTNSQYDGNAFNPSIPDGETIATPTVQYLDGSVGMSFNTTFGQNQTNTMFLGAAYHHLNRPRNSFYVNSGVELDPKYVFSAGMKFGIDEFSSFVIQADHSKQGTFTETIGGVLYSYKLGPDAESAQYTLDLGMFLRLGDALIPVVKLEMSSFSVAISYDVNVSELKTASQGMGGVELSLSYIGFFNHNSSRDKVLCPKF
ncbi:MAG: PorP/SprF family type IX secretion system membrane protein [Puia sp.]|nr:PorP/SprF family type IX secretion system membrane protein [Puia sp.]